MKFYIYWKGTKDKSDYNVLQDPTITEYTQDILKEAAAHLNKVITKDTAMFGIPEISNDKT